MNDSILKLTDVEEISVKEDEYHNLVLHFESDFSYEKGDTIKVWCSKIYEEAVEDTFKKVGSWYKVPIRKGMKPILVPPGIDKNRPEGGLLKAKGCEVCGGKLVMIRGRNPGESRRKVCPTCAVEIIESILDNCNNRQAGTEA